MTTKQQTTAIVPAASKLANRTATVVVQPQQMLSMHSHWMETKRTELAEAKSALKALTALGGGPARRSRVRERVRFLERFVKAMGMGYLPIPRFNSETLDVDLDELPAAALTAWAAAKESKVFQEVRFVPGQIPSSNPGGHSVETRRGRTWTRKRLPARDPLIVGVIRTPEHRVRDTTTRWQQFVVIPAREEHFLIAFWRPEDEHDWTMF